MLHDYLVDFILKILVNVTREQMTAIQMLPVVIMMAALPVPVMMVIWVMEPLAKVCEQVL